MEYEKALELYLNKNKNARRMISRLQRWDEKKTVKANGLTLRIGKALAYALSEKYNLAHLGRKDEAKRIWGHQNDLRRTTLQTTL